MFHVFKTIIPLSEFSYNHMQNILRKIKKLNKFTQIRKTFVSVFECFFSASAKNLLLQRRQEARLCSHIVLRFFQYFLIS